jgi:hypothetical protein
LFLKLCLSNAFFTEPRLRDLRRIHEVFGEAPIGRPS